MDTNDLAVLIAVIGCAVVLAAGTREFRIGMGLILIGIAGFAYKPAHAADWGNGLNCDAIGNLSRGVMTQKELGTDKQSLKVMAYTAAIGSGTTSLVGLTDAIVESAFRLNGMTPNLFAAIMYNECARANYDVASKGKKKGML